MPSSMQCHRAGRTIASAVAVHQSPLCVCVCEGGYAVSCRAAQWSLSSLMRLHCPNLTANPIVMLCTLIAEGARREAGAAQSGALQHGGSTRLVTPDTREEGLVGLPWTPRTGSECHHAGEGKEAQLRRAPLAGSGARLLARCPARTAVLFSTGLCNCFVPK